MISPEECLRRAQECEEIAARLGPSAGRPMIEAAAIWRRLATDEFKPRTDSDPAGSTSVQAGVATDDERADQNPQGTG